MTWLVIFEHPDPRETDETGERHSRRVEVAPNPDTREQAIHMAWRQNARIAIQQTRPLYEFASCVELNKRGEPKRRMPWRRR